MITLDEYNARQKASTSRIVSQITNKNQSLKSALASAFADGWEAHKDLIGSRLTICATDTSYVVSSTPV